MLAGSSKGRRGKNEKREGYTLPPLPISVLFERPIVPCASSFLLSPTHPPLSE